MVASVCESHGSFDSKETKKFGRILKLGCPQCAAANLSSHHKSELASKTFVLEAKGIPARHQGSSFDGFNKGDEQGAHVAARLQSYIDHFSQSSKKCSFIVLSCGSDSAPMACAMLKAAGEAKLVSRYTTAQDYILAIRASYSSNSQDTEGGIISKYAEVDLLVLDDLESTRNTQDDQFQLSTLLEKRYNSMLPTLIVNKGDNYTLSDRLGGDIFEQITKNGKIFSYTPQTESSLRQVKTL